MASASPSIEIPVPRGGHRPDADPYEIGFKALTQAENWIYRDGEYRVRPGYAAFATDINQRPTSYFQYLHQDGALRTIKGTTVGWWKFNSGGNSWTDISGTALTASPTQQQIFRAFQKSGATWLLGTNGADSPKKWDGLTATYVDMGGTPPQARAMMVLFDRILLGNLLSGSTVSGSAVDVSANKDFDSGWGGTAQTEILTDTPGEIVSMMEMGILQGAILKSDAIYNAIAIASTSPFRFEIKDILSKGDVESGPASAALVIQLSEGLIWWLGKDGACYAYDGIAVTQLPYRIQKRITDTANFASLSRAWGFYDRQRRHAWFIYPETDQTDPNIGVVINRDTFEMYPRRWSTLRPTAGGKLDTATGITIGEAVGTLGASLLTIGEYRNTTPRIIIGDKDGQAFYETGFSDNGVAIPHFSETGLDGTTERFITVQEIEHRLAKAAAAQRLTVKLGQANYGETRVLGSGFTLAVGSAGPYVSGHRDTGKYFSLRLEGDSSQLVHWKGALAYLAKRGKR